MTQSLTEAPTHVPTVRKPPSEALKQLEKVVLQGNLKGLTDGERVAFYARVCESLGLNPLTRPFEYIELQGKLTLYVRKDATDQLRDIHGVSVDKIDRDRDDEHGLYTVTTYVHDRYGRQDSDIGVVSIKGVTGEALANAMMKASTKSKRRATLSICGLGWMDEIEALDTRAVEVAPREQLKSAIASRTAALTGGNDSGESDAGGTGPAGGAEAAAVSSETPQSAGSPTACAHIEARHQATEQGVVCGDCGTLLAERAAETKPRGRAKATAAKPRQRKAPTEDGYHRAKAHGLADERGLDPDALKRVAGDVLEMTGDWSRKDMTEDQWEYVAGVVESAPVKSDDAEAWLASATVFAGNAAIAAGVAKKLETDAEWAPVEESIAEMFRADVDSLTPAQWVEYGLRIGAKA